MLNPVFGLTMSPQEFVLCLHLWLGLAQFPSPSPATRCYCGSVLANYGDHILGCHSTSLRNKRHDALCDIVYHSLLENNTGTRSEQSCSSDSSSHPGEVATQISSRVVQPILTLSFKLLLAILPRYLNHPIKSCHSCRQSQTR